MVQNDNIRISNFIAPQFFERYSQLQLLCKQARDQDKSLRTKVLLGSDNIILKTKKLGESRYQTRNLDYFGPLPSCDNSLEKNPRGRTPIQDNKRKASLHKSRFFAVF